MEVTVTHVFEVLFSAAIFLFVWRYVGIGIFKPFFDALQKREDMTSGAEDQAKALKRELEQLERDLESKLTTERLKGMALRDELVQTAKSEKDKMVLEANGEAEKSLHEGRAEIDRKKKEALSEIDQYADSLSAEIVEQVLQINGDSGSKSIH